MDSCSLGLIGAGLINFCAMSQWWREGLSVIQILQNHGVQYLSRKSPRGALMSTIALDVCLRCEKPYQALQLLSGRQLHSIQGIIFASIRIRQIYIFIAYSGQNKNTNSKQANQLAGLKRRGKKRVKVILHTDNRPRISIIMYIYSIYHAEGCKHLSTKNPILFKWIE